MPYAALIDYLIALIDSHICNRSCNQWQESYRCYRSPSSRRAGIRAETIENPITELRRRNYGVAGCIRAARTLHPAAFAHIYAHVHEHSSQLATRREI